MTTLNKLFMTINKLLIKCFQINLKLSSSIEIKKVHTYRFKNLTKYTVQISLTTGHLNNAIPFS